MQATFHPGSLQFGAFLFFCLFVGLMLRGKSNFKCHA